MRRCIILMSTELRIDFVQQKNIFYFTKPLIFSIKNAIPLPKGIRIAFFYNTSQLPFLFRFSNHASLLKKAYRILQNGTVSIIFQRPGIIL